MTTVTTYTIIVERTGLSGKHEFLAWLNHCGDNNTSQYAATAAEAVALVMAHIDEDTIE